MNKLPYILLFFLAPMLSFAQEEPILINNHEFNVVTEIVDNEWETKDTVNILFRNENGQPQQVLKYYSYKDRGGDCNNVFWNTESMEVQGDSVIFTTHFFQKTGIDPIPEWRKQVYLVNAKGELILIYDKLRYYNSTKWV